MLFFFLRLIFAPVIEIIEFWCSFEIVGLVGNMEMERLCSGLALMRRTSNLVSKVTWSSNKLDLGGNSINPNQTNNRIRKKLEQNENYCIWKTWENDRIIFELSFRYCKSCLQPMYMKYEDGYIYINAAKIRGSEFGCFGDMQLRQIAVLEVNHLFLIFHHFWGT